MASPRNVSSYLPNLLGPLDLQQDGVSKGLKRATWNFVGVSIEDDPENERTNFVYTAVPVSTVKVASKVVDADYVLTETDYHVTDKSGGHTHTLPLNPEAGREVRIRSRGAPCTLQGNGKNIKAAGIAPAASYVQAAWEEATVLVYVRDDVLGVDEWEVV